MFLTFLSCTSISKTPLHSKNLIFKIDWIYSSFQGEKRSFSSLVSIQADHLLRLDILQPFIGIVGSFILNDNIMILKVPIKKKYYKGAFNSKIFFPDFPKFPSSWFSFLLRAKTPQHWNCQKLNENLSQCQVHHFKIQWEYKRNQLKKISIKDKKHRQIEAKIKSFSSKEFPFDFFKPSLKNFKRQTQPLFFQKDSSF